MGAVALRAGLRSAPLRYAGPSASAEKCWSRRAAFAGYHAMSMDTELQKHYALLLGVNSPWGVKDVQLKLDDKKVEIELGWQWGSDAVCPECGRKCSIPDLLT